jgi:hypothetical protein
MRVWHSILPERLVICIQARSCNRLMCRMRSRGLMVTFPFSFDFCTCLLVTVYTHDPLARDEARVLSRRLRLIPNALCRAHGSPHLSPQSGLHARNAPNQVAFCLMFVLPFMPSAFSHTCHSVGEQVERQKAFDKQQKTLKSLKASGLVCHPLAITTRAVACFRAPGMRELTGMFSTCFVIR